ncbi:hypothetical protein BG004_004268 [Podila humilis]|nr:hypothetical protein BG004_004268 [Podila humilis]
MATSAPGNGQQSRRWSGRHAPTRTNWLDSEIFLDLISTCVKGAFEVSPWDSSGEEEHPRPASIVPTTESTKVINNAQTTITSTTRTTTAINIQRTTADTMSIPLATASKARPTDASIAAATHRSHKHRQLTATSSSTVRTTTHTTAHSSKPVTSSSDIKMSSVKADGAVSKKHDDGRTEGYRVRQVSHRDNVCEDKHRHAGISATSSDSTAQSKTTPLNTTACTPALAHRKPTTISKGSSGTARTSTLSATHISISEKSSATIQKSPVLAGGVISDQHGEGDISGSCATLSQLLDEAIEDDPIVYTQAAVNLPEPRKLSPRKLPPQPVAIPISRMHAMGHVSPPKTDARRSQTLISPKGHESHYSSIPPTESTSRARKVPMPSIKQDVLAPLSQTAATQLTSTSRKPPPRPTVVTTRMPTLATTLPQSSHGRKTSVSPTESVSHSTSVSPTTSSKKRDPFADPFAPLTQAPTTQEPLTQAPMTQATETFSRTPPIQMPVLDAVTPPPHDARRRQTSVSPTNSTLVSLKGDTNRRQGALRPTVKYDRPASLETSKSPYQRTSPPRTKRAPISAVTTPAPQSAHHHHHNSVDSNGSSGSRSLSVSPDIRSISGTSGSNHKAHVSKPDRSLPLNFSLNERPSLNVEDQDLSVIQQQQTQVHHLYSQSLPTTTTTTTTTDAANGSMAPSSLAGKKRDHSSLLDTDTAHATPAPPSLPSPTKKNSYMSTWNISPADFGYIGNEPPPRPRKKGKVKAVVASKSSYYSSTTSRHGHGSIFGSGSSGPSSSLVTGSSSNLRRPSGDGLISGSGSVSNSGSGSGSSFRPSIAPTTTTTTGSGLQRPSALGSISAVHTSKAKPQKSVSRQASLNSSLSSSALDCNMQDIEGYLGKDLEGYENRLSY